MTRDRAGPDLRLPAYAKINLSLEIIGRRADGFHEIVSVTQLVSLADRVVVTPSDTLAVEMQPPLVDEGDNLARRAALALAAETGQRPRGIVRISKQIPLVAGLGGGSSDAAATLRLLDRLWGTRLGYRRLAQIGATLGSDVPLFLGGGLSVIRGRGEIVETLTPAPAFGVLLIYPDGAPPDKTRALYGALTPADFGDGASSQAVREWLAAGRSVSEAPLVNGFDAAADRVYLGFPRLRTEIAAAIGRPVHLSGAGPTLFALFDRPADAALAAERINPALPTFAVASIARRPSIRATGAL
jgi:4-diphosphocytidyl-2-C-methyl-D-erythritol kinase